MTERLLSQEQFSNYIKFRSKDKPEFSRSEGLDSVVVVDGSGLDGLGGQDGRGPGAGAVQDGGAEAAQGGPCPEPLYVVHLARAARGACVTRDDVHDVMPDTPQRDPTSCSVL